MLAHSVEPAARSRRPPCRLLDVSSIGAFNNRPAIAGPVDEQPSQWAMRGIAPANRLVGRSIGQWTGGSVGGSVNRWKAGQIGREVGESIGGLVNRSAGESIGKSVIAVLNWAENRPDRSDVRSLVVDHRIKSVGELLGVRTKGP